MVSNERREPGLPFVADLPFVVLLGFIALAFLTGGGARGDIQSLVLLRPAAVLVFAYGLWGLGREQIARHRFLYGFAMALFALVALNLIPLPPALWRSLPGRDLVAEVDRVAGMGAPWRPFTMVPSETWNALFSLFVPAAVLVLATRLPRRRLMQLLSILIGFALLSGLLGLLQAMGSTRGPLYFYRITNAGAAVGLFANRNHQAIFLATAFPMLAVFASTGAATPSRATIKGWAAIIAGALLIPLLLNTGSRVGIVVGVISLLASLLLYRKPRVTAVDRRKAKRIAPRNILIACGALLLIAITLLTTRSGGLRRLVKPDPQGEMRLQVWGPILEMAHGYFPWGSGVGTFVKIYQIGEPYALLDDSYLNHAHNDLLEIYLTVGLPALVLLAIALVALLRAGRTAFGTAPEADGEILHARLGAVIVGCLLIGSLVDYPLRVPSLELVLVIAAVWLNMAWRGRVENASGA